VECTESPRVPQLATRNHLLQSVDYRRRQFNTRTRRRFAANFRLAHAPGIRWQFVDTEFTVKLTEAADREVISIGRLRSGHCARASALRMPRACHMAFMVRNGRGSLNGRRSSLFAA
jgi:hypothetical protein